MLAVARRSRLGHRLVCSALGLGVVPLATSAEALGLTVLAQERYVEASSFVSDAISDVHCNGSQRISAPGSGPFEQALAFACSDPTGGTGPTGGATQTSEITATSLHASGGTSGAWFEGHEGQVLWNATGVSSFSVTFRVDETVEYELATLIDENLKLADSEVYVYWALGVLGGPGIDSRDCADLYEPYVEACGIPEVATGTLAPGDYVLSVRGQSYGDLDVPGVALTTSFDVTFRLIPEPTVGLLTLQGLVGMALAVRRNLTRHPVFRG
jgi:hypothetical protein